MPSRAKRRAKQRRTAPYRQKSQSATNLTLASESPAETLTPLTYVRSQILRMENEKRSSSARLTGRGVSIQDLQRSTHFLDNAESRPVSPLDPGVIASNAAEAVDAALDESQFLVGHRRSATTVDTEESLTLALQNGSRTKELLSTTQANSPELALAGHSRAYQQKIQANSPPLPKLPSASLEMPDIPVSATTKSTTLEKCTQTLLDQRLLDQLLRHAGLSLSHSDKETSAMEKFPEVKTQFQQVLVNRELDLKPNSAAKHMEIETPIVSPKSISTSQKHHRHNKPKPSRVPKPGVIDLDPTIRDDDTNSISSEMNPLPLLPGPSSRYPTFYTSPQISRLFSEKWSTSSAGHKLKKNKIRAIKGDHKLLSLSEQLTHSPANKVTPLQSSASCNSTNQNSDTRDEFKTLNALLRFPSHSPQGITIIANPVQLPTSSTTHEPVSVHVDTNRTAEVHAMPIDTVTSSIDEPELNQPNDELNARESHGDENEGYHSLRAGVALPDQNELTTTNAVTININNGGLLRPMTLLNISRNLRNLNCTSQECNDEDVESSIPSSSSSSSSGSSGYLGDDERPSSSSSCSDEDENDNDQDKCIPTVGNNGASPSVSQRQHNHAQQNTLVSILARLTQASDHPNREAIEISNPVSNGIPTANVSNPTRRNHRSKLPIRRDTRKDQA